MVLNIICLHGFTQNADIMKKKLSKLTKSIKGINLYFLNGPIKLPGEPDTDPRAYWIYDVENPLDMDWADYEKLDTKFHHLEDSLNEFIELGKQIGTVDGIIGFSQGGIFTDYICKLHAIGKIPFDIKFAVFVATREFNKSINNNGPDVRPAFQTLHMYGLTDTIIPFTASKQLAESYPNKDIYLHSGAHIIPSTSAAKNAFKKLLSKFEDPDLLKI